MKGKESPACCFHAPQPPSSFQLFSRGRNHAQTPRGEQLSAPKQQLFAAACKETRKGRRNSSKSPNRELNARCQRILNRCLCFAQVLTHLVNPNQTAAVRAPSHIHDHTHTREEPGSHGKPLLDMRPGVPPSPGGPSLCRSRAPMAVPPNGTCCRSCRGSCTWAKPTEGGETVAGSPPARRKRGRGAAAAPRRAGRQDGAGGRG